jgi:hypothetical protein
VFAIVIREYWRTGFEEELKELRNNGRRRGRNGLLGGREDCNITSQEKETMIQARVVLSAE